MTSICGMQSLKFENALYLKGWASVAGKKEGEGPLGNLIDQIIEDPYFGQERPFYETGSNACNQ